MKELIIGYGEIGKAVRESVCSDEVSIYDLKNKPRVIPTFVDVMHVCIPYFPRFIKEIQDYIEEAKPRHIVVWSTVPIGTCQQINPKVIHTPVEGKHPDLALSITYMTRWIGCNSEEEGKWFVRYCQEAGLKTKMVGGTDITEALKLLSTTEYGVNIEFARYKKQVGDAIGMDYELTKEWNREYNKLYQNLGLEGRFQKFVLDAPEGPKGGHCVTPNARLLQEQYPNEIVKIVGEL